MAIRYCGIPAILPIGVEALVRTSCEFAKLAASYSARLVDYHVWGWLRAYAVNFVLLEQTRQRELGI